MANGDTRLNDPSGKIVVNGVRDFKAHGEITEFDPPRVLAYTWLGNWHEHPERPSTARWELSATRTGTRVKVTHSGLANEPIVRKDYAGGWPLAGIEKGELIVLLRPAELTAIAAD